MRPPDIIRLTPGKRVLFLTRDPELIRRQIRGEVDLQMRDLGMGDLLDDINTDVMTPAWVCLSYRPEEIAQHAYAGLIVDGERLIPPDGLRAGNFEVIVSGLRKGVGSSRETAVQAEKWSGIRMAIAASFAPIHAANNINQGLLMGDHAVLERLQAGEGVSLDEFRHGCDDLTRLKVGHGGLFAFSRALAAGEIDSPRAAADPRPQTMAEKILTAHAVANVDSVRPGDAAVVRVDGGYSHEFTTAQVHHFLGLEFGPDYEIERPWRFAVFEDHLIYADEVPQLRPFLDKIEELRRLQREFQRHTRVRDFSAEQGVSPGICHEVAREQLVSPGQFILATDSHTCMGGCNNALTWGVGATEYANLLAYGVTTIEVPESIRFELSGQLRPGVTAKDLMLFILLRYARRQKTLDRVIEFGGDGLASLSMDERATLTNMATECSARGAIVEADDKTFDWIGRYRDDLDIGEMKSASVAPDPGARYDGGVFTVDLDSIRPMVAHPGDPDRGIASDPTNGELIESLGVVPIDIAYGGSCTAGKIDDMEFYHHVVLDAVSAGRRVAPGVDFLIQFGSRQVEEYCRERGFLETFERGGVQVIAPGCGACIGCGPGVSEREEQVTVSAINRNYKGRSGPGRLYLASPLTVAASAFEGVITAYEPGMFSSS